MNGKISVILVLVLVVTLAQAAGAQLPQTLDEMKQDILSGTAQMLDELRQCNYSEAEQHFTKLQTLVEGLGEGLKNQESVVRVETFEVLGVILGDMQNSLIKNVSIWSKENLENRYIENATYSTVYELVTEELEKIGNIAGPILIAGLQDRDIQVQFRSVLALGVLLGGRAKFQDLSFTPGHPDFQNLFSISPVRQRQIHQQLELLKEDPQWREVPEHKKWIEVLTAISDKVHEMIEASK